MGSSRPSAPSTEIIQEPQTPIITGTHFSRPFQQAQAALTNSLQASANTALENYFANRNIGRAPEEEYKPMSFGTFDYETLLPTDKQIAQEQQLARQQERQERRKERRKEKRSEREKYAEGLAATQKPYIWKKGQRLYSG